MAQQDSVTNSFFGTIKAITGTFMGMACCGAVIMGVCVVGCAAIVILVAAGQDAQQDEALAANNGMGAKDNLIPAGEWIKFDGANVRVADIVRPANNRIQQMNMFNDEPAAGTEYVLVSFEVECLAETCNGFGQGVRLLDDAGKEWSESGVLVLADDLDGKEGIQGSSFTGWQAFEFPIDGVLNGVGVNWGVSSYLFTAVPE